ncbi:protein transport protein SEC24 [Yarrowia lipolytica]|nr:protein transport protein SEC24 [Yarrowia lipolytica]
MSQEHPEQGSSSKRRVYPQQQYDFAAAQPAGYSMPDPTQPYGASASPSAAMYGGAHAIPSPAAFQPHTANVQSGAFAPPPGTPGSAVDPPVAPGVAGGMAYGAPQAAGAAYGYQGLTNQMGNLNIGGGGAYQGGAPPGAAGGAHMAAPTQLNQIYNTDLLQNFPPPISDLTLPPPPVILPPGSSVTGNPDPNADSEFMRCTLNTVPTSSSLLKKSKLPFALVIRPYTALRDADENVPTVADTTIARCRRCRSYINPYVVFLEGGARWRCNMCNLTNDVPSGFDYDAVANKPRDRWSRAELNHSVVEFVAPAEYMVRPPQPLVYVFVLDVSVHSVKNGLLATAARTIKESLSRIPNVDNRTRVGFLAVDSSLHYFAIPRKEDVAEGEGEEGEENEWPEPRMMVVSDIDDPFLPMPTDLLVNLSQCKGGIEKLLDSLQSMFAHTVNPASALGSAVVAAHKLIANIGGKIVCLTSTLPNVGQGKLEVRDDKKALGTSREGQMLQTASTFYKSFAVECSKTQVTVDMFLFSSHYQDVASLSNLPRFSAGQTYFYPGWIASNPEDANKFALEFSEYLSQELATEAVLRVRSCDGIRMSAFYGNFFSRSSDLCSFSTFPRDQSYVIEVNIEETIVKPWVTFQAAILHSTASGERRIRVITRAFPTSALLQDIYASADQIAITTYLANKAVEKALQKGPQDARDLLMNRLNEMFTCYKKDLMTTNVGASAPLQFCTNLRMLPLLVNALIKHIGFRKTSQIPSDLRSAALCLLSTLPDKYLIQYIYPNFYNLIFMPDEAGLPDAETGQIVMPSCTNLSGEHLISHGLFLIDDGQVMFLWVGRDAQPALLQDVFGVSSITEVPTGKTELPVLDNQFNERIRNIISKAREKTDAITYQHLYVVREDGEPALRLWATTHLVEDRVEQSGVTYHQFLTSIREKLNS